MRPRRRWISDLIPRTSSRKARVIPPRWEQSKDTAEYLVHAQCRGTDRLTFSYTTQSRSEGMTGFACGGPTWFNVSVPEPGYFITFSGDPAAAAGVEYIFAVAEQPK